MVAPFEGATINIEVLNNFFIISKFLIVLSSDFKVSNSDFWSYVLNLFLIDLVLMSHFDISLKFCKKIIFRFAMADGVVEGLKPTGFKPIALDGGYGWLVVLGSFLIHVFINGFVYSFGAIAVSLAKVSRIVETPQSLALLLHPLGTEFRKIRILHQNSIFGRVPFLFIVP